MSTESYSKWWIKTKEQLEKVEGFDRSMIKMKSVKDRTLANQLVGGLYARYSMVVQDMDACMDQMIQVQKSFTVRKLMNAAVTRLNELKEELTKLDISEYHYIDGALVELKLIPHEVEIIHPTFVFPRTDAYEQFWRKLKNGETIYEPPEPGSELPEESSAKPKKKKAKKKVKIDPLALLKAGTAPAEDAISEEQTAEIDEVAQPQEGDPDAVQERKSEALVPQRSFERRVSRKKKQIRPKSAFQTESQLTEEEKQELRRKERLLAAIILIQSHEQARQARLYYADLRGIANMGNVGIKPTKGKPTASISKLIIMQTPIASVETQEAAATMIQKHWRGHVDREKMKRLELKRRLIIGMTEPSWHSQDEFVKLKKSLERRREIRDQAIRDYIQANIDEKARVLKVVAPGLFEDIGDEIRQWFKDWYYTCKVFKDIPSVEEGGTILVIRGDIETPDEHYQDMLKSNKNKDSTKDKAKLSAEDKKKELEKKKKQNEMGKKSKSRAEDYEFIPSETPAIQAMTAGFSEYKKMWEHVNDADNPSNKPYMEMITEQKCYDMQLHVRPKVDAVMRIELDLLKASIAKAQGKKSKGKAKKGKKGKKAKGGKGKKGKKGKKDPTGNRKVEDLFQELYNNGIIRKYPEVHIDEYNGDFSYQNWEKRARLQDPPATLADARQAVIMNCIIPLGVEKLVRPKSVLLVGPRECELEVLANAVFNETRCVLFDLSPKNVAGKYPGKKGNKDLTNLVTKMSRLLAPSIIYVENVEKTFYKKVPKDEREDEPKRVGKFLMSKIVKPITANDRVLVLGTTYFPWLGQAAKLKKTFQRIILVPRSDYGSVYIYWRKLLMPYHAVDRNMDISCLTIMTKYYPLPQIRQAIERVLSPNRLIQLSYKPLTQYELITALREGTGPVNDTEWSKYLKFYAGTKLAKERKALMATFEKLLKSAEKQNKVKK